MACFSALGFGVTHSELDRYTDNIGKVLIEVKGRRFFKDYLMKCTLEDGMESLTFWEKLDGVSAANSTDPETYEDLIKIAHSVKEFDAYDMNKLESLKNCENKDKIIDTIKELKNVVARTMKSEYDGFKRHCLKRKNSASFICQNVNIS